MHLRLFKTTLTMKQFAILCSIFIGSLTSVMGQNSEPEEGTYQFLIHSNDAKKEFVFTNEYIISLGIEGLRPQDHDTTVVIDHQISLYLPSKKFVESKYFTKLELIRYE